MPQRIDLESYRKMLWERVREAYEIARKARATGLDVTQEVEMPLASDMADRIEELIGIKGIASEIRQLAETMSREEISISISRRVAEMYSGEGKRVAVEKAVRVGLAILTEGILVAPLEGIASVEIATNSNGTDYVSIVYSGPIRGAGGTAQALSVLISDIVRRDLGIGSYIATDDEIERYIEEIQSYNRLKHLQYLPSPEEIRRVVRNLPVCIDGEGSEEEEVSGHRDMERVSTNRIRGGMCLVLCEGLLQKSKKVLKHTSKLGIKEWDFLSGSSSSDNGEQKTEKDAGKSEKFLKDLVAGRPVFGHPNRPGGFRLRYGRSRLTGLAAAGINPATMIVADEFIATGAQIKVELPGKAAAVTPCDGIDGPMVLLDDGSHIRVESEDTARAISGRISMITDMGEILIAYGDFLENNHKLVPGSFNHDWWRQYVSRANVPEDFALRVPDELEAISLSEKYRIPLHPRYDYFWHDLQVSEIISIRKELLNSSISEGKVIADSSLSFPLIRLGVPFASSENHIIISEYLCLLRSLGLSVEDGKIRERVPLPDGESEPLSLVSHLSGLTILPRSPTRVGARLGRPEKAGDRKMKPKVHVLFPVESYGSTRRSIRSAGSSSSSSIEIEMEMRICRECKSDSPQPICPNCGSPTIETGNVKKSRVDLHGLLQKAEERMGIDIPDRLEIKGVKKLMSSSKAAEPIEKGILRAIHDISINKDGTCRYDMSDIPITHFRKDELMIDPSVFVSLGYDDSEMNEILPQDIIIPYRSAEYLLKVTSFVDDLLTRYYGMPPFYMCQKPEDLIGHLVIGLAPHTSGGIVGRIIGFSNVSGCYAHPFYHAAKRRNCDGDEDSIMLLMDGLLNFSKKFLPSTRGGLMDAPLVLTVQLNPEEVDKEAMNVDTVSDYPLEFYERTLSGASPVDLEEMMMTMGKRYSLTGTIMGTGFSTSCSNINQGVTTCSYKTIDSMEEKIERQLKLARRIRAVDADDVAARVLNSHFLPDMYGNFRKFFSQEFRCTRCNSKYRRVPLSGKCLKCGNRSLTLTIHRGSIMKYMNETVKISEEFNIPWYLKIRIDNLVNTIKGTFNTTEPLKGEELNFYMEEEVEN